MKAGETRNLYQISTLSQNQTIYWNESDGNTFLESLLQEKDASLMLYGEPWQQLSYIFSFWGNYLLWACYQTFWQHVS